MVAVLVAATTPDTTRSYTVTIGPHDVTGDTQWDSLVFEDQGSSAQGTLELRVNGALSSFPGIRDQQVIEVVDHMAGGVAFRGFVDSRRPARLPEWNQIEILASSHDSLLDNVIPFETRPAGESDNARIGYLWGKYATGFLAADLTYVQQVSASLPAQIFAGVTLRQAIDMIAAQASSSAFWYLDSAGRPHYGTSEVNNAPKNVTSDTPGAGEIAPMNLDIDFDSKGYVGAVYVRGKTDAGSGWVQSESSKGSHNGLMKTGFFDAPDCTTSTMRDNLGRMYLGRVGAALSRGSFSSTSKSTDGWRAGQNVTVRSTHLGNINQAYRIARVRTSVLGPLGSRPAALRHYDVEFGSASGGRGGGPGPVVGTGIVGDILDENGNLLLGAGSDASASGFGAALRRYITSGVLNGDFAVTPPYPDSSIVQAWNPLPWWTWTQAGGTSITAMSVEDTASGSGRVLEFTMAPDGAAADDSYIEQLLPVNASRSQAYCYRARVAFTTGPTVSVARWYITAQYVKSDKTTTTGAAATTDGTTTAIGASTIFDRSVAAGSEGVVPTDAQYLRLRIGFKRDVAATTVSETLSALEAHLIVGPSEAAFVDIATPANNPGRIIHQSDVLYVFREAPGGAFTNPFLGLKGTGDEMLLAGSLNGASGAAFNQPLRYKTGTSQALVAGSAISANAPIVRITATGAITLTSAPTVADGTDGQIVRIVNVGSNAITIQDQGTLASSNLRLSTTTFAIGPRDSITLLYSSDIADWIEIARTNVI